jgi:replicative DNA helicase
MSDTSYNNMHDMLQECLREIQSNAAKFEGPGISSGICSLDDLIGGFEKGKVYVIGGRPCMGKEEFMLSMIRNIIMNKVPVLLFSTNHLKKDYIYRLLSMHSDIPSSQLQKGYLETEEWDRLDNEIAKLSDAPLFIHDSLDLPINEFIETTRNCIKEKDIEIIFIDCLQMIDFARADDNPSEKVAKVMCALKQLAYEVNLPIVVGAMLNRRVEHREGIDGKRPQLGDFANSCFIEELADVVMMVHRPEYYKILIDEDGENLCGLMEIVVMKNAFKLLGSVFLEYQQHTGFVGRKEETVDFGSKPVNLKDLKTDNEAVSKLIKTFDLEEETPL